MDFVTFLPRKMCRKPSGFLKELTRCKWLHRRRISATATTLLSTSWTTFLCVFQKLQKTASLLPSRPNLWRKPKTASVEPQIFGKMDYQQYTGYQTMGYNSAYHYQYATPNHLKVGSKPFFNYLIKIWWFDDFFGEYPHWDKNPLFIQKFSWIWDLKKCDFCEN